MDEQVSRKMIYTIIFISLLLPVGVMFWNIEIGAFMLVVGLFIAANAGRVLAGDNLRSMLRRMNPSRLERHREERGRTIWVQLVDDYGRMLPPMEVQRRMEAARAQAGPRDNVVGVKYVLKDRPQTDLKE